MREDGAEKGRCMRLRGLRGGESPCRAIGKSRDVDLGRMTQQYQYAEPHVLGLASQPDEEDGNLNTCADGRGGACASETTEFVGKAKSGADIIGDV